MEVGVLLERLSAVFQRNQPKRVLIGGCGVTRFLRPELFLTDPPSFNRTITEREINGCFGNRGALFIFLLPDSEYCLRKIGHFVGVWFAKTTSGECLVFFIDSFARKPFIDYNIYIPCRKTVIPLPSQAVQSTSSVMCGVHLLHVIFNLWTASPLKYYSGSPVLYFRSCVCTCNNPLICVHANDDYVLAWYHNTCLANLL